MIRTAAVVLPCLALLSATAHADASATTTTTLSKKEAEVRHAETRHEMTAAARKKWNARLERQIGKAPEKVINVFNGWTHENMVVAADGKARLSDDEVNRFLRCRYTNKQADMDGRLLPTAIQAARHFHSDRIVVVSGFRSPKYNLTLIKKGREVSRKSQHKKGKALDFRLDGVSPAALRDWAKSLGMGGVGYYQHSGFVHIDTAAVRYWNGR